MLSAELEVNREGDLEVGGEVHLHRSVERGACLRKRDAQFHSRLGKCFTSCTLLLAALLTSHASPLSLSLTFALEQLRSSSSAAYIHTLVSFHLDQDLKSAVVVDTLFLSNSAVTLCPCMSTSLGFVPLLRVRRSTRNETQI